MNPFEEKMPRIVAELNGQFVEVLLAFDKQVTPLFQQVHANLHQSHTLATLRDTLLPKLLSGELSVAGIESKLEAVT